MLGPCCCCWSEVVVSVGEGDVLLLVFGDRSPSRSESGDVGGDETSKGGRWLCLRRRCCCSSSTAGAAAVTSSVAAAADEEEVNEDAAAVVTCWSGLTRCCSCSGGLPLILAICCSTAAAPAASPLASRYLGDSGSQRRSTRSSTVIAGVYVQEVSSGRYRRYKQGMMSALERLCDCTRQLSTQVPGCSCLIACAQCHQNATQRPT